MSMAQTSATQTRGAPLTLTVLAVLLALAARPPACAADPPANSAVTCDLDAGYQIVVNRCQSSQRSIISRTMTGTSLR